MIVTPLVNEDIRDELSYMLFNELFVTDKTGQKTIELICHNGLWNATADKIESGINTRQVRNICDLMIAGNR
ncbi:hypothetical protein RY966_000218 [Enterobacter kobei]|nr:hypothetical protein [Enterobacter kobei]